MDGIILKVTMIPRPEFGCVIMLQSKPTPIQSIYQLTVSFLPECNCPAFKDMISKFGRKRNSFMHCKHLNFIFIKVSNVDHEVDLFIHAPTFSFNEVKFILEEDFLIQSTSYNSSHPNTTFCPYRCGIFSISCEVIIVCYNKYNFMYIFILFKMLYYNVQLYYVFFSQLNVSCLIWRCFLCLSNLLPCCQLEAPRCFIVPS